MKMVAAAKLNRAEEAVKKSRPYANRMGAVIANIYERIDPTEHPLLTPKEEIDNALIYVISTNRGLCGAYNLKLFRKIEEFINANEDGASEYDVTVVGEKAELHFTTQKEDIRVEDEYNDIIGNVDYEQAARLGEDAKSKFLEGDYDALYVTFNEFVSALKFNTLVKSILPISIEELREDFADESVDQDEGGSGATEYIYEPSQDELLQHILPTYINVRFLHALLEANASEQGTRMTAMDNATQNAEEMIDDLTLKFNRARQAQITREICEITSGAEALES
jgi:F-type H+-transporting ATPase subunit gamma